MRNIIIVDMQKDFIDGSLKNNDTLKTVPLICKFISTWKDDIFYTLDTHKKNYLSTQEGVNLPIIHCVKNTDGHKLNKEIYDAIQKHKKLHKNNRYEIIEKPAFGYDGWKKQKLNNYNEVIFVGTRTDICVISNVLALKNAYPEIRISVVENLCSGTTRKDHKCAIQIMKCNQINII